MKKRSVPGLVLSYAVLVLILVFLLFPIYWMVITGLKSNMEAYRFPPSLYPHKLTLSSFRSLFFENNQFFVY